MFLKKGKIKTKKRILNNKINKNTQKKTKIYIKNVSNNLIYKKNNNLKETITVNDIKKGLCFNTGDVSYPPIYVKINDTNVTISVLDYEKERKVVKQLKKNKELIKKVKLTLKKHKVKYNSNKIIELYLLYLDDKNFKNYKYKDYKEKLYHDIQCLNDNLSNKIIEKSKQLNIWKENIVSNFKRVFISGRPRIIQNYKKKYPLHTLKINGKQFIYPIIRLNYYNITYGKFILIHLKDNKYIGIFDYVFELKTPDNDKIIYVSQGSSNSSGDMSPFLIGEKYTYFISNWTGNYYFDNEFMKTEGEIDPWVFYKKKIFDKKAKIMDSSFISPLVI